MMQEAIVALTTKRQNAKNRIQELKNEINSKDRYINQIVEYSQKIQRQLRETFEELRVTSIDYDLQSRELADVQDHYDCLETQYNLLLQKFYHSNK